MRRSPAPWSCLGETHAQLGDAAQAVACYKHAVALFRDIGNRYGEASALAYLADLQLATGDHAAARDAQQRSQEILDALDPLGAERAHSQLRHLGQRAPHPARPR